VKEYDLPSRKISGYGAIFNNKDKADDILIKGCFAKSIEERGPQSTANDKILLLWQHDQREPLGRITELKEDDRGLYFEAEIDDIEIGDRALKQLESGTLNQFSIGYNYVWENVEYDSANDAYIVKEVKLHEISVVSIGCNGLTEYLGLKSDEDINNAYEELAKEINEATKHMSAKKQAWIQSIIGKAMSLASMKPKADKDASLDAGKADSEQNKSLFNFIQFKKNEG
jgi:HK97 family phage prohead protease